MPAPIAPTPNQAAPAAPYKELLASIRKRFETLTVSAQGPTPLFTTDAQNLYARFLDALPAEMRQTHTCASCRRFVDRYGSLARVEDSGKLTPVLWDPESAPEPFKNAIRALAAAVVEDKISEVFLSDDKVWGTPKTGEWEHIAVVPHASLVHKPSPIKSTWQVVAEKREDYKTLLRALDEFPVELVKKAHALLSSESLYRSEAVLGVAKWLLELHKTREGARNAKAKENLTWLAVARAPAGFCHVKSTMIGTLLEDLAADLPFADVKAKFAAKMDPLKYQRAQVAPTAGNIERAEKIVEKLKSAGSVERRFARLADIQTVWIPKASKSKKKDGVFSHLLPNEKGSAALDAPSITMTWEKFARTVLPNAASIEFFVPTTNQPYIAMVTAKNPDAPPILQWDFEDHRNTVSSYVYHGGSAPEAWNLKGGVYHPVTAVALQPYMWHPTKKFDHLGGGVIFILKDCKDVKYKDGGGFFPSWLKSEYHEIRATMEAYAKSAVIAGKDEAEACGISLSKSGTWNQTFRVTSNEGITMLYKLDRWD